MSKKPSQLLTIDDLRKKINWQLSGNFYTLKELQSFSLRRLRKILRLIAKVEGISLKRRELTALAWFIKSDFKSEKASAEKLWAFVKDFIIDVKIKLVKKIVKTDQLLPFSYQAERFEIMRN